MKGSLPKAYLRIDPNLDQTHPDCGAFVRLLCAGARQPVRGRFKSWAILVNAVGRGAAVRHRDVWRDVHPDGEGMVIDGWEIWQEGDLTVGERMQRYRNKQRNVPVTEAPQNRITPSETVRQQGSKASGTEAAQDSLESQPTDVPGESAPALETAAAWPEAEQREFADAVWDEFLLASGSTRLAGPGDYDVLREWMGTVPLRIVLRGIRDCVGKGKTLAYYRPAVSEAYQQWRAGVPA